MDDFTEIPIKLTEQLVRNQEEKLIEWLGAEDRDHALRMIETLMSWGFRLQFGVSPVVLDFEETDGSVSRVSAHQDIQFKIVPIQDN